MALPVLEILPALKAALAANRPVALVAPPGAGKTTALAPALLDAPWAAGQRLILLSPRRLAARAAAERMAALAEEPVGRTIGYRTRMDSKVSTATRIEVVTEGLFTRMLVDDPELTGIAAILFDEVHERSLESDLALALTLDARAALRPDLRILLMSATLDGAAYDGLVPDLQHLESQGRMFPVTLRHIGRPAEKRLEDAMASTIRTAIHEEQGSILAFLPGAAEIERTAERLADRLPQDIDLHRLYGAREGVDQRAAIAPAPPGRRKLVLATSIAETSITIDGVRVVIDSGLARRPRLDPSVGMVRLVTERASLAAVTQRAGRAGRTAPGVAIRLWEAAENAGLPRFDPPEILESDLAGLVLECARWGVRDLGQLQWRDQPPAVRVEIARKALFSLGVLDEDGRVTAHGEKVAGLPLAPALGHMLMMAGEHTQAAANIAVLLSERGLGGRSEDLDDRLRRWATDRSPRAEAARRLARNLARMAGHSGAVSGHFGDVAGPLLALAWPDRVARRRGQAHLMANGRAVQVPDTSPLARAEWIMVADAAGAAAGARLLAGAAIDAADVERLLARDISTETRLAFVDGGVVAETVRRLGAITLKRQPHDRPDPAAVSAMLLDAVQKDPAILPMGERRQALLARLAFLHSLGFDLPDVPPLQDWLAPLLTGQRRLDTLSDAALTDALEAALGWETIRRLDQLAPPRFETPAGSHHAIDYAADGGPAVDVRVQALFGLARHPTLAEGRAPLTLRLTSPAGRPIQVTRDLPGFWAGSWADVRKDLRGRYPKHPWPEDPASAPPTLRAKPRGQ